MRTDALLIFPSFLEVWTEVNAFTITDSSSLGMLLVAVSEDDASDQGSSSHQ